MFQTCPQADPSADPAPGPFTPWARLFGAYLLFLYGPMSCIYLLSFQGRERRRHLPDGRPFHRLVPARSEVPARWRTFRSRSGARSPRRAGQLHHRGVCGLPPAWASAAAFPAPASLFYIAVASLVMPGLLVGFGIGLGFRLLGLIPACSPRRLARN